MQKRHFIALAELLRRIKPDMKAKTGGPNDLYLEGRLTQWEITRDMLASDCASMSPRFDHDKWSAYVNGGERPK